MNDKFNILYESIKKTILEQSSISVDKIDSSKYKFAKDANDNLLCTFTLTRDGEEYVVLAKYFKRRTSFAVTYPDGKTKEFKEQDFAKEFYKDYDDYREAFDKYIDNQEHQEKDAEGNTKIENFSDVLADTIKGSEAEKQKVYKVNGMNFLFEPLKDDLVTSFYKCEFQIPDEETKENIFYKLVISVKPVNSIIVKITKFNDKGESLGIEFPTALQTKNKELYDNLFIAIRKLEKYIQSEKKNM